MLSLNYFYFFQYASIFIHLYLTHTLNEKCFFPGSALNVCVGGGGGWWVGSQQQI
jgi:hypothetical protein